MDGKDKSTLLWAFFGLVFVLAMAASAGIGYHVRDLGVREENRNIRATIQQLENSADSIGTQLGTAQKELERGQRANSQAGAVTTELERSNAKSQQLIDDSRARLSELKKQLTDIDRANKLSTTRE